MAPWGNLCMLWITILLTLATEVATNFFLLAIYNPVSIQLQFSAKSSSIFATR